MGGPMRRLMILLGIIVAAFALGGLPSAVAANPGVSHFAVTFPDTQPDFCGTGQAVDLVVSIKATVFSAPNQPVDSRSNAEVNVVYTNPQNGATVLRHSAGPVSDKLIS